MAGRLTVEPFSDTVEVEPGESMLQCLMRHGRHVRYGCKHGGCGTCRAQVISGKCRIGDQSAYSLSEAKRKAGMILLCAAYVEDEDVVVDVSKTMDIAQSVYMDGKQVTESVLEVTHVETLSPRVRHLCFTPIEPNEFRFMAGQYIELEIPGGKNEWRDYSLAGSPKERDKVELLVKLRPGGRLSHEIASGSIRAGVQLRARGPLGQFRLRRSNRQKIMIASGSGMAPIRAMLYQLATLKDARKVTFYYGAQTTDELILFDEMNAFARENEWFEFVPVVQNHAGEWTGEEGMVTEVLEQKVPSLRGKELYACGSPGLINATIELAESKGCKSRHIYFERFVPSG